tara:strand:+ start:347 stop:547 length:201 start_codon:yes stop_codon:yes gene_type:complete
MINEEVKMDHSFCMTIITALGGATVSLAGVTYKILLWYKKEAEGRLKDTQELAKIVNGENDETKIQ